MDRDVILIATKILQVIEISRLYRFTYFPQNKVTRNNLV